MSDLSSVQSFRDIVFANTSEGFILVDSSKQISEKLLEDNPEHKETMEEWNKNHASKQTGKFMIVYHANPSRISLDALNSLLVLDEKVSVTNQQEIDTYFAKGKKPARNDWYCHRGGSKVAKRVVASVPAIHGVMELFKNLDNDEIYCFENVPFLGGDLDEVIKGKSFLTWLGERVFGDTYPTANLVRCIISEEYDWADRRKVLLMMRCILHRATANSKEPNKKVYIRTDIDDTPRKDMDKAPTKAELLQYMAFMKYHLQLACQWANIDKSVWDIIIVFHSIFDYNKDSYDEMLYLIDRQVDQFRISDILETGGNETKEFQEERDRFDERLAEDISGGFIDGKDKESKKIVDTMKNKLEKSAALGKKTNGKKVEEEFKHFKEDKSGKSIDGTPYSKGTLDVIQMLKTASGKSNEFQSWAGKRNITAAINKFSTLTDKQQQAVNAKLSPLLKKGYGVDGFKKPEDANAFIDQVIIESNEYPEIDPLVVSKFPRTVETKITKGVGLHRALVRVSHEIEGKESEHVDGGDEHEGEEHEGNEEDDGENLNDDSDRSGDDEDDIDETNNEFYVYGDEDEHGDEEYHEEEFEEDEEEEEYDEGHYDEEEGEDHHEGGKDYHEEHHHKEKPRKDTKKKDEDKINMDDNIHSGLDSSDLEASSKAMGTRIGRAMNGMTKRLGMKMNTKQIDRMNKAILPVHAYDFVSLEDHSAQKLMNQVKKELEEVILLSKQVGDSEGAYIIIQHLEEYVNGKQFKELRTVLNQLRYSKDVPPKKDAPKKDGPKKDGPSKKDVPKKDAPQFKEKIVSTPTKKTFESKNAQELAEAKILAQKAKDAFDGMLKRADITLTDEQTEMRAEMFRNLDFYVLAVKGNMWKSLTIAREEIQKAIGILDAITGKVISVDVTLFAVHTLLASDSFKRFAIKYGGVPLEEDEKSKEDKKNEVDGWIGSANQAQDQLNTMYPEISESVVHSTAFVPKIKAMQGGLRAFITNAQALKTAIDGNIDITNKFAKLHAAFLVIGKMNPILAGETSSLEEKMSVIMKAHVHYDMKKELFKYDDDLFGE